MSDIISSGLSLHALHQSLEIESSILLGGREEHDTYCSPTMLTLALNSIAEGPLPTSYCLVDGTLCLEFHRFSEHTHAWQSYCNWQAATHAPLFSLGLLVRTTRPGIQYSTWSVLELLQLAARG